MMKKAIKNILIICLIFAAVLSSVSVCFASETILYGYYVESSDLDAEVRRYVSSLYLSKEDTGWGLYINGSFIGQKSGSVVSFSYSPNANTYYVFTFDTSNKRATSYYKNTTEETVVSIFSFAIENAVQTVVFQSDSEAAPVKRTAPLGADGYYDFGEYSFTYVPKSHPEKATEVKFNLKVNSKTNKALITRGASEYTYSLSGTGKYETVYCEDLVPAQELNLNYMELGLEKQTYPSAKTILYSASDIDSALSNQVITLKNNLTGLTTTVPLQRTITHWVRKNNTDNIGDGSYDEYQEKVQVVCQWGEDLCASIRSKYTESGRPFAVYGTSTTYDYVTQSVKKAVVNNYQNISWPASSWSGAVSFSSAYSNLDSSYGIAQYRKAPATWSAYSAWEEYTGTAVRRCSNSSDCEYETRTAYAYKTRSWNPWTTYAYTSCTEGEGVQCQSALKYSQRTRSWGSWSGYTYTGTESLGCSDVASAVGADCDREGATRYAKQTGTYSAYSDWSSWSTGSCASTALKNCESKTAYAWRSMGAWSAWEPTTLNVSCSTSYTSSGGEKGLSLLTKDCMTEAQTRYKTRTLSGYTYSGYSDSTSKQGSYTDQCTSSSKASSLCGVTRTYGANQLSKYGSYQSDCLNVYGANSLCGITYSNYTDGTSRHGITSECTSTSKASSLCGTQNKSCTTYSCATSRTPTYNSCATSACGVKNYTYSSYTTTTSKHGYTDSCSSSTGRQSACGTENKSCTRYYCATARTCTKKVLGVCTTYSYSSYRYGYGSKPSPAYDCSSTTVTSSSCGTQYKSCTTYSCATARTANYNTCADSACGVKSYSYSGYTTSTSKHGYTDTCTATTGRQSACGTENKTCTIYNCPTSSTNKTCYLYSCPTSVTNKTCTIYSCPSTRTANYSAWSSWSDWSTASCTEGTYKTCDSKTVNYKRTRDWGDWSSYSYTYGATSSTIDYKSQTQTRYQTRTLSWGDYSDYIYASCTENATTNCKSATRYRVRYLSDWSSWSAYNLDSCTKSDTSECQSKTMYSKRTLGDWGALTGTLSSGLYTYTSCADSDLKQCFSQQQLRTRTKSYVDFGSWSGNYRSLDAMPYDSNYGYEYRYNNGTYETSLVKGTSNTVGVGSMYVKTTGVSYKDVASAIVSSKTYTNSERMTSAEITAFASQIGTDAGEAYYVKSYISSSENTDSSGTKFVTWDYWEDNKAVNSASANAAVSRFTGEKRFIPYIFITKHYRATNKKFYITGYDNEGISTSFSMKTQLEDEKGNIIMHPDESIIYDYCETHPNDTECFCAAHPNDDRCRPADPEPDYCEVHPDETFCFCQKYPMSDRCKAGNRESSVIYYNYLDPLENYDASNMPSNWQGYEALTREIKNSDLSEKKIQVTLSKEDLERMRVWLSDNPNKEGTCQMIRDFSYIFTEKDEELLRWLTGGSGCRVNP